MSGLVRVDLEGALIDERWAEMQDRAAANARPHCEFCGAFVSVAAAKRQMRGHSWSWGDDYGPRCEPGKGCNRTAATSGAIQDSETAVDPRASP